MKYFCILLVVVLASARVARSDDEEKQKFVDAVNECKEETGASDADVESMMKHEAMSGREGKCMRACVFKKFNILTADGKLNKEAALEVLKTVAKGDESKEKIGKDIIEICEDMDVPDDACEAAEQYRACYHKHAEEKDASSLEF